MAAHRENAYADHRHIPLPLTEQVTDKSLILPLFHQMTVEQQDAVVSAICQPILAASPAGCTPRC
jgi:dTDP-4-amino-4,6-dideoxygalactose transaminase